MATVTSLTAEKIEELLSGWESIALSQEEINIILSQVKTSQDSVVAQMEEFQGLTLAQFQAQLDAASTQISQLNDTTLPQLQVDLDNAKLSLENLNTVDLPGLQELLDNQIVHLSTMTKAYVQAEAPTNPDADGRDLVPGDTWIDSDDNDLKRWWDGTVWTTEEVVIPDGSITESKIATGAVTALKIAANSIVANHIVAGTITALQIAADTITGNEIAADSITANELAADSVTADQVAAGAIDGMTITGAFIRTAATGKRWELQSGGTNTFLAYSGVVGESIPGGLEVDAEAGWPIVRLYPPKLVGGQRQAEVLLSESPGGLSTAQLAGNVSTLLAEYLDAEGTGVLTAASVQGTANDTNAVIDFSARGIDGVGSSVEGYMQLTPTVFSLSLNDAVSPNLLVSSSGATLDIPSGSIDLKVGSSEVVMWGPDSQGMSHKIAGVEVFRAQKVNTFPVAGSVKAPCSIRTDTSSFSVPNSAFTVVPFATNTYTTAMDFAGGTFTAKVTGIYHVTAALGFSANGTGLRIVAIYKNGASVAQDVRTPNATSTASCTVSKTIQLDAGDTVSIRGWQNSGGALALVNSALYNYVDIAWLGWSS